MLDRAWIANTTEAEATGLPLKAFAPNGDPIDITNHYVNFGASTRITATSSATRRWT